ncbi:MAG: 4Fe-4S binding protein [Candidatus Bathyarchaeia archaeon]
MLRGGRSVGGHHVADWRLFKPVVEADKCRRCWLCVMYCPEGAITRGEGCPVIDLRFCKGCGICSNECPARAVEMVEEE